MYSFHFRRIFRLGYEVNRFEAYAWRVKLISDAVYDYEKLNRRNKNFHELCFTLSLLSAHAWEPLRLS